MSNTGHKGIHETHHQFRIAVGWRGELHVRYLASDLYGIEDALDLRRRMEAEVGKPHTEDVIWWNRSR